MIAGVYSDGTAEAVELARDAKAAGAAGILLFPPTLFMWGAQGKPDMVIRHYSEVATVGLPIIAFEYPPASGIGYAPETLARPRDPATGGREGLVERDRGVRAEPARAARHRSVRWRCCRPSRCR